MKCDKCEKEFGRPVTLRIHQNNCEVEVKKTVKVPKKVATKTKK